MVTETTTGSFVGAPTGLPLRDEVTHRTMSDGTPRDCTTSTPSARPGPRTKNLSSIEASALGAGAFSMHRAKSFFDRAPGKVFLDAFESGLSAGHFAPVEGHALDGRGDRGRAQRHRRGGVDSRLSLTPRRRGLASRVGGVGSGIEGRERVVRRWCAHFFRGQAPDGPRVAVDDLSVQAAGPARFVFRRVRVRSGLCDGERKRGRHGDARAEPNFQPRCSISGQAPRSDSRCAA